MKEANCKICQDSGWVLIKVKGREIARPCQCRQNDSQSLKIDSANFPPRFLGAELKNFTPDKNSETQENAKNECIKFVKEFCPKQQKGLLIQGPTGVGKTRLVCSIGNEIIKKMNVDVFYIDWNDLTREMRSGEDTSNRDFSIISQVIQRMATVELLLFDEVGASRPSPWVLDNIYYIVNRRYNEYLTTIFASNFFDDTISNPETLTERIGQRIRSRLYEMAKTIKIHGNDFRQEHY